eukprot:s2136_g10.t1
MILLSFCDGIGCARLALEWLVGPPTLAIAWETDPECVQVTAARFPDMQHRGCFIQDDYREVANCIRKADPEAKCTVLVTAGTPCPDYSVVSAKTEGRNLPEGSKFTEFTDRLSELEKELPYHQFMVLAENVIMNDPSDGKFISEKIGTEPVVIDAADASLVSRPRLWWARINWQEAKTHPLTGNRLHCSRPPPKKHKLKTTEAAWQRWLEDSRQFAPWQYADHAMLWKGDEAAVIPPCIKEELHGMPRGWSRLQDIPNRSRHRMLANSWHMYAALVALSLVLQFTTAVAERMPSQVHRTAIRRALDMGNSSMALPGPGVWSHNAVAFPPCNDAWEHWKASEHMVHPAKVVPEMAPGLQATFQVYANVWHHLNDLRMGIIQELDTMIVEWKEITTAWFAGLPPELQTVYTTNGSKPVTQVPVMIELLKMAGHQGADQLDDELSNGFAMTGALIPGTGWLPRTDERYSNPISEAEFRRLSRQHVADRIRNSKPSPHWRVMLDELLDDRNKGRVEGPLQAPPDWGVTMPPVDGIIPSPAPTTHAWAAVCFAVVRRCEDYRRSSHNSTVYADDCPHYENVESYVANMRHLQALGLGLPQLWGHDLTGAYRQIPLQPSDTAYTVLLLPEGPSLWRHRAAPFGATASVWAFCRLSDSMVSLARRILISMVGHFVDDFTRVELGATADSSCSSFKLFFQKLGLSMKPEKEQLPASRQKVLGVIIHAQPDQLTIETCPKRSAKILQTLDDILQSNRLTPDEAQRVAGKLGFLATTMFGGIGTAAIQPFYARAHHLGEQRHDNLTFALRAAINILKQLLIHGKPRTFTWSQSSPHPEAVVYSDAFFLVGETVMRARDAPTLWNPKKRRPKSNGWGFVVRLPRRVVFAHGELPEDFISKFVSRKAFIYMMEIMAAFIAVVFLQNELPPFFVMFIDNQAGKAALQKGYGSDGRVNTIITAFWSLVSEKNWFPTFQYVKSELNISDAVSRHDTSFAKEAGWDEMELDLTALVNALEAFAADQDGSISDLVQAMLAASGTPSGVGIMHGVVESVHIPRGPLVSAESNQQKVDKTVRTPADPCASSYRTCLF